MNDAAQCTGIWKDNYAIQLVPDRLFVRVSGGVRSVTARYGDEPARPIRLASKMEEDIGAVILSGIDFEEFAKAGRLRLRVGTAVRGVAEFDIDAAGLERAYQHMAGGCPPTSQPAASKTATGNCPAELVARLRTAGVSDKQIRQACDAQ